MTNPDTKKLARLQRRRFLLNAGGIGAAGLGIGFLTRNTFAAAVAAIKQGCSTTPSMTEGPFYINPALLRSNITDGLPGIPLILDLKVVQVGSCTPVKDAIVDIWHCNVDGLYSGFNGQLNNTNTTGENFLRGIQVTDQNGLARFCTIYPGWYPGRTVHIHIKVITATRTLTSQLYFDDGLNDEIFTSLEPYDVRGNSGRTRNNRDGIFNSATVVTHKMVGGGVMASHTLGIA
ncbi:MAG: intradiol ring-cleavage dioxygenase [Planctomycetes bacterium]|nr:intradiol ring-cleavage dioxygenase [Planctomycetota bacterium]